MTAQAITLDTLEACPGAREEVARFEKTRVRETLAACGGNVSEAARVFGDTRRRFELRVKKLGP